MGNKKVCSDQRIDACELIVIKDGSTDSIARIVETYGEQIWKVGKAIAERRWCNAGARAAAAKMLSFYGCR